MSQKSTKTILDSLKKEIREYKKNDACVYFTGKDNSCHGYKALGGYYKRTSSVVRE